MLVLRSFPIPMSVHYAPSNPTGKMRPYCPSRHLLTVSCCVLEDLAFLLIWANVIIPVKKNVYESEILLKKINN